MIAMQQVFISTTPEDRQIADAIRNILQIWGVKVLNPEGPAQEQERLSAASQQQLNESTVLLRLCTSALATSYFAGMERSSFLNLQSADFREGHPERRQLINLIVDPAFQPEAFDLTGTVINATKQSQRDWLNEFRVALQLPETADRQVANIDAIRFKSGGRTNRRGFIAAGIGGLAVLTAGSAGAWYWLNHRPHSTVTTTTGLGPAVRDPRLKWFYKVGDKINSTPAVSNGLVFCSAGDGSFVCLDTTKHTVVWSSNLQEEVAYAPAIIGNTLALGYRGVMVAGKANENVKLWEKDYPTTTAVIGQDNVDTTVFFIGGASPEIPGTVLINGLNPQDGSILWEVLAKSNEGSGAFTVSVAYSNHYVYGVTVAGFVFASDVRSVTNPTDLGNKEATVAWTYQIPNSPKTYAELTATATTLYTATMTGMLYALDAKTGKPQWIFTAGGAIRTKPATDGRYVYIGSADMKVYAIEQGTGEASWSYTTGGNVLSSPTLYNGAVYVGSGDGYLYVLNSSNGTLISRYHLGDAIGYSSPVIDNGLVYIGCKDGYLYVFSA